MCDILALTFLMSQPIRQHRRRKRTFARLFSPYHVLGPTDVNTIVSVLEAKDVASIRAGFCFAQQVSGNACVLAISTFSFISGGGGEVGVNGGPQNPLLQLPFSTCLINYIHKGKTPIDCVA